MGFWKKLFQNEKKQEKLCSAVIVAAGSASRMEGKDKIFLPIGNVPVLIQSLKPFQESPLVREIIVVAREDRIVDVGRLCRDYGFSKLSRVVPGGETRILSVQAGLSEVSADAELIAIHDGARPFLTTEILEEVIQTAGERGAAAPAVPVKDTIKIVKDGVVQRTPDRSSLFAVQTPQVFDADLIRGALAKALQDDAAVTDDCAAVERMGFPVVLTRGSEENIKITTPSDILLGETILEGRETW